MARLVLLCLGNFIQKVIILEHTYTFKIRISFYKIYTLNFQQRGKLIFFDVNLLLIFNFPKLFSFCSEQGARPGQSGSFWIIRTQPGQQGGDFRSGNDVGIWFWRRHSSLRVRDARRWGNFPPGTTPTGICGRFIRNSEASWCRKYFWTSPLCPQILGNYGWRQASQYFPLWWRPHSTGVAR